MNTKNLQNTYSSLNSNSKKLADAVKKKLDYIKMNAINMKASNHTS